MQLGGPNNGTNAIFGDAHASSACFVNVTTAVKNLRALQFNASGYILSNNSLRTVTFSGTGSSAAANLQVTSDKSATIGTNITIVSSATTIWGAINGTGGGELIIQNGGTLFAEAQPPASQVSKRFPLRQLLCSVGVASEFGFRHMFIRL